MASLRSVIATLRCVLFHWEWPVPTSEPKLHVVLLLIPTGFSCKRHGVRFGWTPKGWPR